MAASMQALLSLAQARLRQAGCDTPRLDAVLLLAAATGTTPDGVRLNPDAPVEAAAAARFDLLVKRREAREPVAQILGRREFWGLDFIVSRSVLDPRADSETLIDAMLRQLSDRKMPLRLVDFGTGSGCLLLSLLHELPGAWGVGIDRSEAALAVARENAGRLGLHERVAFTCTDWGSGIAGAFDILISNPPYIETAVLPSLAPEVALYEPRSALDGGPDGLDTYRRLLPDMRRLAAPGALVGLEVGAGQGTAVTELLVAAGFEGVQPVADLAGHIRVLLGRRDSAI